MKHLTYALTPVLCLVFSLIMVVRVYAQEFNSPGYRIESGALILQPDLEQDSANYDAPASFGPDIQKKFEEKGYVVVNNVDADSLERPFVRLKLDKSQLVFDSAEARGEAVQQSSVNISGSGAGSFIVSLRQHEQFKNGFGAKVEQTQCDNESHKCTPLSAEIWRKASGFGYRVANSIHKDFDRADTFRPLFVGEGGGQAAILLSGESSKSGLPLNLTFKLRPSVQVQTGIYKGTVIITASADY